MKEIVNFIRNKSIDLASIHVDNFAFLKQDALKLLDIFKANRILLYGGDFLEKENNQIKYNYINWATNEKDIIYNIEYARKFILKHAKEDMYIEFVTDLDLKEIGA